MICVAAAAGTALADPTVDADEAAAPSTAGAAAATATAPAEKRAEYGIGVRLRSVRAPKGLLELFVARAPGGSNNYGLGVDLTRRRGSVELQLGFEYEHIQPAEGVWIQSNTNVATGDEADYIVGPDHNNGKSLGWFTIEFTFLNHAQINKKLAIRYGGGAGVGVIRGELGRYNIACVGATNESPEPGCVPAALNGTGQPSPKEGDGIVKYSLPPVFPVVNAILGVQIRPVPKMTINIEGGIRTFPFFGISTGYFF
ncbi:MAG TPA: hypothetical protein VN253_20215 [Kofleriaceae bacterium]|nr:hypothetical protein [Kofleriaceae bacterium]